MRTARRCLGALAVVSCALAASAPVSHASPVFPSFGPPGGIVLPGNQIAFQPCVGTNRPAVGANAGSTSHSSCGQLIAIGPPQVGQVATVIGPVIIGTTIRKPVVTTPSTPVFLSVP
jgi:hypothetical protein